MAEKETKETVVAEEVSEAAEPVAVQGATTKKEFQALIEAYKAQNPKKYEAKKERLEAKLKAMK